jgi:putative membrane protein
MLTALFRSPRSRRVIRWLTHPVVAFGLYNANMWLWHIPTIFDATPSAAIVEATWLVENLVVGGVALITVLLLAPRVAAWLADHRAGRRNSALSMTDATDATGNASDAGDSYGASAHGSISLALMAVGVLAVISLTAWGALNVTALTPMGTLARAHNPLHLLMNLLFVGTAILYWAPLLSPAPVVAKRITPLFGMLYLFISTQPMMALGALLTFAAQPLYHVYDSAPLLWGFTRLGDQQLAGLTMWLLMDAPLLVGLSILFFRWVNQLDRAERLAAGEGVEPVPQTLAPEQELIWEPVGGTDGR